jgi:hypothetical protein
VRKREDVEPHLSFFFFSNASCPMEKAVFTTESAEFTEKKN